MKKKELTKDELIKKLKRDNIRFQVEIAALFMCLLALFFFNYNYTIFKILMAGNYTDTAALDTISTQTLGEDSGGNYYKNFDNMTISVFMDKLYETNGDNFTMLFRRGALKEEHEQMESDSELTVFKMLDDNTGMLTLTTFSGITDNILKENLDDMKSCKSLVIDLRDNPGGILKQADKAAELFLPEGSVIAQYNYRSRALSSVSCSKNTSPLEYDSIYILQNENTASAAEVFINALRDNLDNVTVIGSTSYGKGIGQTEMKLLNGYGIKATTLDILTPNGSSINHSGIKPDVETDNADKYIEDTVING